MPLISTGVATHDLAQVNSLLIATFDDPAKRPFGHKLMAIPSNNVVYLVSLPAEQVERFLSTLQERGHITAADKQSINATGTIPPTQLAERFAAMSPQPPEGPEGPEEPQFTPPGLIPEPGSPVDLDRKRRERVNEILEEIARTNGNDFMGGDYDQRVRERARELQRTEPDVAFALENHLASRLQIVDPHFTRPAYIEPTASSVTRHKIRTGDDTDVAQSVLSLTEDQVRNLHPLYQEDLRAKLEPVAEANPCSRSAGRGSRSA